MQNAIVFHLEYSVLCMFFLQRQNSPDHFLLDDFDRNSEKEETNHVLSYNMNLIYELFTRMFLYTQHKMLHKTKWMNVKYGEREYV